MRILRLVRQGELISADTFEALFKRHLNDVADIVYYDPVDWGNQLLWSDESSISVADVSKILSEMLYSYDFFSPGYGATMLLPLLLAARKQTNISCRMLFIAHSPGGYIMEWTLMYPFLRPGDLIIAPSNNAKEVIEFLMPGLKQFVRVIPHPIHRFTKTKKLSSNRLVSLSRIAPAKLIHRQIEAMSLLEKTGHNTLHMEIAGPLVSPDTGEETNYVRALREKIKRLELSKKVYLVGPVIGDEARSRFLSGVNAVINLSIGIEESFSKASVEAIACGVPVIATRWNGLPETVGRAGVMVPVIETCDGRSVDIKAKDVANAIESVLDAPPSESLCFEQARKFHPDVISKIYLDVLEEAYEQKPDGIEDKKKYPEIRSGLIERLAPYKAFSWQEIFRYYLEHLDDMQKEWNGKQLLHISKWKILHGLLLESARPTLAIFMAGLACKETETPVIASFLRPCLETGGSNTFFQRLAQMATEKTSNCTRVSREICLFMLMDARELSFFDTVLNDLYGKLGRSRTIDYLMVEARILKGEYWQAFRLFKQTNDIASLAECDFMRMRQVARLCRNWKKPELALPWLREWLKVFPDAPESGAVWLALCANSVYSGEEHLLLAKRALERAEAMLGRLPAIRKLEVMLHVLSI